MTTPEIIRLAAILAGKIDQRTVQRIAIEMDAPRFALEVSRPTAPYRITVADRYAPPRYVQHRFST